MEIRIPEVGESIIEARLAKWHCRDGATIAKDDLLCELETDKITLDICAEQDGVIRILAGEGETLPIGTVIATLKETDAANHPEELVPPHPGAPFAEGEELAPLTARERLSRHEPLSPLRLTIARRLLQARQNSAIVTTFNEADMSRVMELRSHRGERFARRHGVKLGLMAFFVKACIDALREYPVINARMEEQAIVYQEFYDIGIAVATEQGLVVPVLRDADAMTFADTERRIAELADKAREHRLELADLQGGTFSISNGGVYGSLLGTPLPNPPQSAILGMHSIQQRAVVRNGQIVARPMMYLALSYDHRLIDGREAVSFLKRVVESIEEPEELLLE